MKLTANKLPDGFTLEQDQDGDWVLFPPANVTIFSTAGEGLLIGKCDYETALSDALMHLEDITDRAALAQGGEE